MIARTVVLSTDDNPDYKNYLPYVQKAWNSIGWKTLTFYLGTSDIASSDENKIIKILPIEGYRDQTTVQCIRLFGHKYISDGTIMTSDIDMMPLSNYWQPDNDSITCYGHDLTNYTQFPICYVAANKNNWEKLINSDSLEELLSSYDCCRSDDFYEWWFCDQLILTEKLLSIKDKIVLINRGKSSDGLALNRIDRANWYNTKLKYNHYIDAHMPRPFSEKECIDLIENVLLRNASNS